VSDVNSHLSSSLLHLLSLLHPPRSLLIVTQTIQSQACTSGTLWFLLIASLRGISRYIGLYQDYVKRHRFEVRAIQLRVKK